MSEPILIDIKLEGTIEGISCEKISEGLYKCLESCLFIESVKYGCEIEVEEIDGKLNFIKVYKKSPFATFCYVWSKEIIESVKCKRMLDEVKKMDGYWEGMMGGVLMIHLPIAKRNEIDRLLGMMNDE